MSDPCIRGAVSADLPRLVDIYNHYVEHTPITFDVQAMTVHEREPWFAQHSSTGRHRLLVCEEAGVLHGYACSHQFRVKQAYDTTVETSVYCAPGFTGRGVGTRLYAALFDALRAEDIRTFIAGVTLPNPASIALHQRFGFAPVGVMHAVGRKFEQYWDVAWFERAHGPVVFAR
jgi:phosphinothricin acetyltransferase